MNKQEKEKNIKSAIHTIEMLKRLAFNVHGVMDVVDLKNIEFIISALQHQLTNGWIPVSERLPEEYGTYMVAWRPINMTETDVKAKTRSQITHFYEILEYDPEDGDGWLETIEQSEGAYKILAWQPLPEPYKEVSHG